MYQSDYHQKEFSGILNMEVFTIICGHMQTMIKIGTKITDCYMGIYMPARPPGVIGLIN
jgi:hypothetical protein